MLQNLLPRQSRPNRSVLIFAKKNQLVMRLDSPALEDILSFIFIYQSCMRSLRWDQGQQGSLSEQLPLILLHWFVSHTCVSHAPPLCSGCTVWSWDCQRLKQAVMRHTSLDAYNRIFWCWPNINTILWLHVVWLKWKKGHNKCRLYFQIFSLKNMFVMECIIV